MNGALLVNALTGVASVIFHELSVNEINYCASDNAGRVTSAR
jgi:hypothetical protein